MIYFIIGIILFNIFLYYILRSIKKFFLIDSIITIISGYLIILFSYIVTLYIRKKVWYINISVLTNYYFNKFSYNGLILILIGGIELIIYTVL